MGSTTISLKDEAYERLKSLKGKNESFSDVVEPDKSDAEKASEFYPDLKKRGEMISQIDILIAAQAYNRDCKVITRDDHFKKIEEIEVEIY